MTITTEARSIAVFVSVRRSVALLAPLWRQGRAAHFYTNLVKLEEGVRESTTSWATYVAHGRMLPGRMRNRGGGYFENPVGGGPGKEDDGSV